MDSPNPKDENRDKEDKISQKQFFKYIQKEDIEGVKSLINKVDLNVSNSRGNFPVIYACKIGNIVIINLILQRCPDLEVMDQNGNTAMQVAIENQNLELVILLHKSGAKLLTDNYDPLSMAVRLRCMGIVKYLIETGYDVSRINEYEQTYLIEAVSSMFIGPDIIAKVANKFQYDIVKILLMTGINPNAVDNQGNTALMCAASYSDVSVVNELILAKSKVNKRNYNNENALYLAVSSEKIDNVRLLLEAGGDPNIQTSYQDTPLMMAVAQRNFEMVECLLRYPLQLEKKGLTGETALMVAVEEGKMSIVKLLVKKGASIKTRDRYGKSAIDYAIDNNQENILGYLLKPNSYSR